MVAEPTNPFRCSRASWMAWYLQPLLALWSNDRSMPPLVRPSASMSLAPSQKNFGSTHESSDPVLRLGGASGCFQRGRKRQLRLLHRMLPWRLHTCPTAGAVTLFLVNRSLSSGFVLYHNGFDVECTGVITSVRWCQLTHGVLH